MALRNLFLLVFLLFSTAALAIQTPQSQPVSSADVKSIVIIKSERKMYLLDRDLNPLKTYKIALGSNPVGHKEKEGDGRTPEGRYKIDFRNPNSEFHRSLRISYPAPSDVARARKQGVSPGGDIFIHGLPPDKSWMFWRYSNLRDWTWGCVAMSNKDMDEVWDLVREGTPVLIQP